MGIGDWGLGPIPNPQLKVKIYFLKIYNYDLYIILLKLNI